MTESLDWFLVLLLLLSTLAYTSVVGKSATHRAPPLPHARPGSRLAISPLPKIAPMWWDNSEGAYMVVLVVGAGVVELVLDTGSSKLSVKGAGCEWRSCTPLGCAVTACPCGFGADGTARTECTEHYYQPTGPRLAPGERGAGLSTTMTYGSQTDTVEHYMDRVAVPVASAALTCAHLANAPSPGVLVEILGSGASDASRLHVGDLVVHRVSHIEGTSSSNMVGLARPGNGNREHGARVVLDDMMTESKIWSIVLRETGGWLALGALPCFPTPHYIPMMKPPSFTNFLTSFYVVSVVSIAVGPSLTALKKLRNIPRYCVIDTGTTSTFGSTLLGEALDAAGYNENGSVLQLKLGAMLAPLTLNYTPSQLRDPDYPSQGIVEAWPGRTLDDYSLIFPDRDGGVLLMGAVMMSGFYWEFDLNKRRIGVTDLRS